MKVNKHVQYVSSVYLTPAPLEGCNAEFFDGLISNLAPLLLLEHTIAVIQRLYHTLLTRVTQKPRLWVTY